METYEEIMRRNEPKNYTVRWQWVDGKTEDAVLFESFEQANLFAEDLRNKEFIERVLVLRSGRHPRAKRAVASIKTAKRNNRLDHGIKLNEEAWVIPEGYVDGDADKHGPVVAPSTDNRLPVRSDREKGEWAKKNSFDTRTCLWQ